MGDSFKMEKRKVIGFGKNSLIVSLPKEWILENKIKKGDELSVEYNGSNLSLSSDFESSKTNKKEIEIDCAEKDLTLVKRLIHSAYINNYNTIIAREFSQNYASQLRKAIKNLFAIEIAEEPNKIVIKDILNINDISLPEIIRRIDNITRNMFEDSIRSFKENVGGIIKKTDNDVNRLAYLALKIVKLCTTDPSAMRALKIDNAEILHIWELVGRLENIADATKRIAEANASVQFTEAEIDSLTKFYAELKNDFISAMNSYYLKDRTLTYKILSSHPAKVEELGKLNLRKNITYSSIIEHLYLILESTRNIARSSLNTFLMK